MVQQQDFLEMIDDASALVRNKYPQAQLAAADHNVCDSGSGWRFVFDIPSTELGRTESGTSNSTAVVMNRFEEFGPVEHFQASFSEHRSIPLPLLMQPQEALRLAKKHVAAEELPRVINLRWPRSQEAQEPQYIITYSTFDALVGVNTQQVHSRSNPIGP